MAGGRERRSERLKGPMSERVTWERCPSCDGLAAVGWVPSIGVGADPPPGEDLVEYDCPAGCLLTVAEIRDWAARLGWPSPGRQLALGDG